MQNWLDRVVGRSTLSVDDPPSDLRKEMVAMTPADPRQPQRKPPTQGTRFVTVTYASSLTEAEFLKGFLESEDIPALVESEHSEVSGIPSMTRGIAILVPDNLLEEAARIIDAHQKPQASAGEEEEEEDDLDEDEDEDLDDEEEEEEDLDEDLEEDEDLLEEEEDEESSEEKGV